MPKNPSGEPAPPRQSRVLRAAGGLVLSWAGSCLHPAPQNACPSGAAWPRAAGRGDGITEGAAGTEGTREATPQRGRGVRQRPV